MSVLAIVVVIMLSAFCALRYVDVLLMLFHHISKTDEESYMALYDSMDDPLYAEMLKRIPGAPKNYSDYLLLLQEKRSTAYKTFSELRVDAVRHVMLMYGVALVVLIGTSFFSPWFVVFPLFGLIHVVIAAIARRDRKQYNKYFYLMVMHLTVLQEK